MCRTDPGGLEWRGHGRSAVGLEGFDGRSEPTIPEFYRKGVFIPTAHGGPKVNFTLISLKVKVFSSAIGSQWSVGGRERLNPPLHGRYPRGGARGLLLKEGFWVWFF